MAGGEGVPGAGQFYNEENEKGTAFLAAGILLAIGWLTPVGNSWQEILKGPNSRNALDPGALLAAMSPASSLVFWACFTLWGCVYVASMVDAGRSAARWNYEQRKARGLEH